MKRTTTILGAAVVVAASAAVFGGIALFAGASTTKQAHWTTAAEMRRSTDGDLVPSLVEPDARDIELRTSLTTRGTEISWTSSTGIRRADCRRGPLTGTSRVGAAWWPTAVPANGWTCGWWSVFEQDGRYFAWDHREAAKS